jgi:hypothetical protein
LSAGDSNTESIAFAESFAGICEKNFDGSLCKLLRVGKDFDVRPEMGYSFH